MSTRLWGYSFIISAFIYAVYLFQAKRKNNACINSMLLNEGNLIIEYSLEGKKKCIEGAKEEIGIVKKFVVSKTRIPYLEIKKNGKKVFEQFETGGWSEEKMDEAITFIGQ